MRFRPLSFIVPIVIAMMVSSVAGPGWWTAALAPLVHPHAVIPESSPVSFAASDNNADNSDSGDNGDNADGGDNSDSGDNGDNADGGDNADNSDSGDNSDNADGGDNSDSSDNSDRGDNSDSADNADGGDNVDVSDSPTPAPSPPRASSPVTVANEASGTSTGGDLDITLPNGRVRIHLFPSTPSGIVVTVSTADPATLPPPPGTLVRGLTFLVAANDGTGAALTVLPAEVHVHTEYVDGDVGQADDQNVTLYWLDPADNQWKPAPKVATDPASNVVEASVMNLGNYVVTIP